MKRMIKYFSILIALVALFAVLSVAAYADEPNFDPSLVFAPETQLTVYVDGEWSPALSDTYGFGDTATITAPAVSGKTFSRWEADGSIISYDRELSLTINAHTTLYAVYANTAPTAKPVAGFTSVTRTNDGESISFQAIASGDTAGIVYSTTATGDALTIGGDGVTNVAAVKYNALPTGENAFLPDSILDKNNCWMLQITPEIANTVYHARAYVTEGGETTYGDVKDVKLSELESGIWMVANLDGFNPGNSLDDALAGLSVCTVTFNPNGGVGATMTQAFISGQSATLIANPFTREGYSFKGWNTEKNGGGTTYTDGQSVTLNKNITLYAQWKNTNDALTAAQVTEMINALPESNKVTKSDKNAIEEARKAYDALTDDEKAKVSSDTLKKLTDDEKALSPQTGDTSHMGLWIAIMIIALCTLAATLFIGKKKRVFDR